MKMWKVAATAVAVLLTASCNVGGAKTTTKAVDDPLAKVQSASLGGPQYIAPGSGAMATCDDNKVTITWTYGVLAAPRNAVDLNKDGKYGKKGCRVQLDIRSYEVDKARLGTVVMLVTRTRAYVSDLLSVGLSTQLDMPDDSTLIVLNDHPKHSGPTRVHAEAEEPYGRVGEIMTSPVYRQLVG